MTFLQEIFRSLKNIEIADDNKIVSLWEQAVRGEQQSRREQQSRSQPTWGLASTSRRPTLGRSLSFHQHKGGRTSMKSTLSTVHPPTAESKDCFGLATMRSCILMFKLSENTFFSPCTVHSTFMSQVALGMQLKNLILTIYRASKRKTAIKIMGNQ